MFELNSYIREDSNIMSKTSVKMLCDTGNDLEAIGEPVRADAYFGHTDGLHTVTFHLENFTGRITIQATLVTEPEEGDWFDIHLTGGTAYVEYPLIPFAPSGIDGDTMVDAFTFQGNFLYVRALMDKNYYRPIPSDEGSKAALGSIIKILLNH